MPQLIVKRPSEYMNRLREIGVYMNGEKLGVLKNNEIKTFDIEPGNHQLKAKIDWCGSQNLQLKIQENQHIEVFINSNPILRNLMRIGLPISIIGFILVVVFSLDYFIKIYLWVGISLLVTMFLFLTVFRNYYIKLKTNPPKPH